MENLNGCVDLVNEFESNRVHEIIGKYIVKYCKIGIKLYIVRNVLYVGAKRTNGDISYLLKYKNESQPVEFKSNDIRAHFFPLAFKYLEKQLIWMHPRKHVRIHEPEDGMVEQIVETQNPIGDPIGIQCNGIIIFLFNKLAMISCN